MDKQTSTMIKELLKKHKTESYEEEIDYISNSKFSESYFYGLPKIHKSEEISNAVSEQNSEYIELLRTNDLKFRPIVGGPNSVTQNLSHFIDINIIVLKPLCREVPSFIRDDLEFLNHLPRTVNPDSELITFDIVSLYTNIPHDLGITAVKYCTDALRNKRLEELKAYLKKQQYPEQVINYGIQNALTKGPIVTESRRSETTEESSNNLNKIIPFVTTYNPRDYDIFSFMRKIETNVHKSEKMDKVLQKKKIINSKRQSKSLKRYLTSSKFDFNETLPIVKKCTDKRCISFLCSKTHLTVNNRRNIVNEKLQDYLAKTLKRNVTICLKYWTRVYRDMKKVMKSPQIRQKITT
ncbi:unnamed protein product [Mytilus coruscus]|uniref:Reverse transcriptase domain-containing protein n=1 Tax=Mytilus coruscus TaxID=42192 RepID=A0A6J8EAJ0_MYTCO|nr:unnamed protein product [Mytilus coruscus]